MSKTSKIVLVLFAVVVLGLLGFVLFNRDSTNNNSSSGASTDDTTLSEPEAAVLITYSDNGFSPSTVTVTAGASITVKNESSDTLSFNSAEHPVHTENDELNLGDIEPGESRNFTVNQKGTWGYHNHLKASQTGTIVVE